VFKKLMVWVAVLLIAALLAVPASAQTADLNQVFGEPDWLHSMFGAPGTGDLTEFCQTISSDPDTLKSWVGMFPDLVGECGF
jgi:hypothetical protein